MPPKPDLVFHTPPLDENEHLAFNVQLSPTKTEQDLPSTSSAPIIEDWISDSEEEDIPQVPKDVPSLAQSPELVKTPRPSGLISPPPMSVALPVPLRSHSPSNGLKRPKKTYFVYKSETHLIKDCDFHSRKLAQNSCAPRDIHKHNAPMKYSRIPLHKVPTAARAIGAARPTFSKTRPHISQNTVSKSKAPICIPFIRHTTPKSTLSPARVHTANPSAVSAARVKAARLSAVSAARINAIKSSAVTAVQHNHTKKGNPQQALKDKGVIDSGCSRHMTGNISYLSDFEELNGGYVVLVVILKVLSPTKPEQDLPSTTSAPIIEDWVSDSEEEDIPKVPKDVPSLAQSTELVKTPRHSGLISPPPMSLAPPVPLRPHSPSKSLKRPKKTCFVCQSETHLIKDCDFYDRKLAQNSCASRDIHKHNAPMKYSRIPLHKVPTAARTIGAARPTFSNIRPHSAPFTVSKSKAPIRRPFIRHTTPKPRLSPPRVNAANPSAVISAARVNTANPSVVSAARVKAARLFAVSATRINAVKPSAVTAVQHNHTKKGNPQQALKDKSVIDSRCSRHMTGNISYLSDFKELNGGYVSFGGNPKGDKITGKDFKLPDASQVLLRATLDESNLWHRRLGHVNFKTLNKLVKGNLVRGLPSKVFTYDLTCVACNKGKQHRASCKPKIVNSVDQPLFRLHMDLFGPTFVKSLSKKSYCFVVTDDYSRFSWVFFLATKDETASVLKTFIVGLENLLSLKVKIIRCDNGTEFENADINQFCGLKGIKREFSVPMTPQQNGIAERKNRTLIKAARTLLADSQGI
nr:putative ribonuclease H-like domain-containing protein [Tanacetum cinerariifolium]